ncbi:hypothetical protein HYN56_21490 [Flavobacterium crocinum]|uniref:Uncharacterized protein n=1 Tax=Flavobacterium crocinum TaxID=2183896 RepID=A0A2S1YRK7_9FLAO|nr:hypothetical protein HYN56_21490 [Flavobacterium crocinum]
MVRLFQILNLSLDEGRLKLNIFLIYSCLKLILSRKKGTKMVLEGVWNKKLTKKAVRKDNL